MLDGIIVQMPADTTAEIQVITDGRMDAYKHNDPVNWG